MKHVPVLLTLATALAPLGAARADDATFKAYGFADVELVKQTFHSNNFLINNGTENPNTQLYLDHLNTYLDWKPNANVRMLAEIALNPEPTQTYSAGTILQLAPGVTRTASQPTKSTKSDWIELERVHADLLLGDEVNVRVGKFITPAGIWNVDHGSPAILTIKQPYETSYLPMFPESQTGAQIFGHTSAGEHDLSYATWVSTGRSGSKITGTGQYGPNPENLDDWAVGTHLQANLAYLDGIRLGGSFQTGTLRDAWEWATIPVGATGIDLAKETTIQVDSAYMREFCYGLDTKMEWKHFLLQAEWNHRQILDLQSPDHSETNLNAWYVLAGRRFPLGASFDVTPYAMYERLTWTGVDNNPGLHLAQIPIKGFSNYIGGVNFGIFGNVRLKVEYSYAKMFSRPLPTGSNANSYTDDDLVTNQYSAQVSVAF